MYSRFADNIVESTIEISYFFRINYFAFKRAMLLTRGASHLEQIRKIVVELYCKVERAWQIAVVANSDSLIDRFIPDENRANDVHHIPLEPYVAIHKDIRVGKIDSQQEIVVAQV